MGCPNLSKSVGDFGGTALEMSLKENKYCRLKQKGPNFETPFTYENK